MGNYIPVPSNQTIKYKNHICKIGLMHLLCNKLQIADKISVPPLDIIKLMTELTEKKREGWSCLYYNIKNIY